MTGSRRHPLHLLHSAIKWGAVEEVVEWCCAQLTPTTPPCLPQIARCFRDEDLRADRQPEFTQVDMEMAFLDQEGVMLLVEDLVRKVFAEVSGVQLPRSFPRLTYKQAMGSYASDKPDLRYGLELVDVSEVVAGCGFR